MVPTLLDLPYFARSIGAGKKLGMLPLMNITYVCNIAFCALEREGGRG